MKEQDKVSSLLLNHKLLKCKLEVITRRHQKARDTILRPPNLTLCLPTGHTKRDELRPCQGRLRSMTPPKREALFLKRGSTTQVFQSRYNLPNFHIRCICVLAVTTPQHPEPWERISSTPEAPPNYLSDLTSSDGLVIPFVPRLCFLYRRHVNGIEEIF